MKITTSGARRILLTRYVQEDSQTKDRDSMGEQNFNSQTYYGVICFYPNIFYIFKK